MAGVECFALNEGRMVQFVCGQSFECCGSECCPSSGPFYIHWYFWLAVCMFLLVLIGFGLSACRHFRKEHKQQCHRCCAMRPKREIGTDLLLNYHLMRTGSCKPTDVLHRLPLYEDVVSSQHPLLTTGPPPVTILLPPPAYTVSSNSNSGAIVINSGNPSPARETYPSQPPPPYYQLCVLPEEAEEDEEEEAQSVHSPPPPATANMT